MSATPDIRIDSVVVGGGIAGLWVLDELVRAGYSSILLERSALGDGQTVCAQGIIHGGLKYTLSGIMNRSATAIAEMPHIWRQCLDGTREPDLTATTVLADSCLLWRTDSMRSRLGMLGARLALRARPEPIEPHDRPEILKDARSLYRVPEPVIEPVSLLKSFASGHEGRCGLGAIAGVDRVEDDSLIVTVRHGSRSLRILCSRLILAAGSGNAELCGLLGIKQAAQQLRPLHMVMMRGDLPPFHGHCVDGNRTRITITSNTDHAGRTVWQLGGQIAEGGVEKDAASLIDLARDELREILPALDLADIEWATYRIDRAEPRVPERNRPDDAFAMCEGSVVVTWPTKLALAPRLSARVVELMPHARLDAESAHWPDDWPRPAVAQPPWEGAERWS